jgi:hypothetical protein
MKCLAHSEKQNNISVQQILAGIACRYVPNKNARQEKRFSQASRSNLDADAASIIEFKDRSSLHIKEARI